MLNRIHYKKKELTAYLMFIFLYLINISFVYIYDSIPSYILCMFFLLICCLSTLTYNNKFYLYLLLISVFLIISSLFSQSTEYGLFKLNVGLLLPMSLVALLIPFKNNNEKIFLKSFIHLIVFLDVITIFIKMETGFFERASNFGLFGPITFGWLNSYLFVILLNRKSNKINILLLFFSFLMIIWSGSKGPFIVVVLLFLYKFRNINKLNFKSLFFVLTALFSIIYFFYLNYSEFRIFSTFVELNTNSNYLDEGGSGSFGTRIGFWIDSLNIWKDNFFIGIGFGNWENLGLGHKYPHNILMELLSETGFLLTFAFIIIFYLNRKNYYSFLFFTGLICQFFSGDFSYFRYYLFFFLIGTFSPKKT